MFVDEGCAVGVAVGGVFVRVAVASGEDDEVAVGEDVGDVVAVLVGDGRAVVVVELAVGVEEPVIAFKFTVATAPGMLVREAARTPSMNSCVAPGALQTPSTAYEIART